MAEAFAYHLSIDLYGCDEKFLSNKQQIRDFLLQTTDSIGMQAISDPLVLHYPHPKNPDRSGITGVIILAESNITIHTFAKPGFAMVDINSCEHFDADLALQTVLETLKPQRHEKRILERGPK